MRSNITTSMTMGNLMFVISYIFIHKHSIYTLRQKLSTTLYFYRYIFYINTVKTIKYLSPFFLHFLKDYTKGSKITNLRSIYHPERRDLTWQKWGSKQALEKCKTSLSLMEVFNIALKCRVFRF